MARIVSVQAAMLKFGSFEMSADAWRVHYVENSIRPTSYSAYYGPMPDAPEQAMRVTDITTLTNPSSASVSDSYIRDLSFKVGHTWDMQTILADGPITPCSIPGGPSQPDVGPFPLPRTVDVGHANPIQFSDTQPGSCSVTVDVPPNASVNVYVNALFKAVSIPFVVRYRQQGSTKFQIQDGNTTKTSNAFGVGTICAMYPDSLINVIDSETVECIVGGNYFGQLFLGFNPVSEPAQTLSRRKVTLSPD